MNRRKHTEASEESPGTGSGQRTAQGYPDGAIKDGTVIRLERPGVQACGPYRRGVDYTVGEGGLTVETAERLVNVKGFTVRPKGDHS